MFLQASSRELQAELARLGAVDLGTGWQGIRPEYLATLLEMIILTATQQGWPLHALPAQGLYDALEADGYDPRLDAKSCQGASVAGKHVWNDCMLAVRVTRCCVERFGELLDAPERVWSLHPDKASMFPRCHLHGASA